MSNLSLNRIGARKRFIRLVQQQRRGTGDSLARVTKGLDVDPELVAQIIAFCRKRRKVHPNIAMHLGNALFSRESMPVLRAFLCHFDHMLKLGWKPEVDIIPLIKIAIGSDPLTPEQERALITLEMSCWDDAALFNRPYCEPDRYYPACTREVAISRPHDIDRIITHAQNNAFLHAAQIEALLDGNIAPPLSEGAL